MTCPRNLPPIILLSLALQALILLPACGGQQLDLDEVVVADNNLQPTASQGTLAVFTPPDLTDGIAIRADGKDVVATNGELFTVGVEAWSLAGNYQAGIHHFEVIAQDGGTTLFAGDAPIVSGQATRLFLYYSSVDALQGSFVTYPFVPSEGTMHLSAVNLVSSGGVQIEVVTCPDANACTPVVNVVGASEIADYLPTCPNTTECAPVSPPLALGETFDADFPVAGLFGVSQSPATNAWFGYRQVATPSLPVPQIDSLVQAFPVPLTLDPTPANYVAAPQVMYLGGCTEYAD
jgi:hypothetical protein